MPVCGSRRNVGTALLFESSNLLGPFIIGFCMPPFLGEMLNHKCGAERAQCQSQQRRNGHHLKSLHHNP